MKSETPLSISSDSWVVKVSSARVKSGPDIVVPGARCIFLMLFMTSSESPAFFATSAAVAMSVNASTPLRR